MDGDGFTDPEFLDSPGNIPGAIRLDDRERLAQENIREGFSWWRPKARPRLGEPSINDLVAHRAGQSGRGQK